MSVFDAHRCTLGEGPLWHPERQQLFWFDIIGKCLHAKRPGGPRETWAFDEYVSAAGWVDAETLLVASSTGLWRYSIGTEALEAVVPLEDDNPVTRSNDGRADPQGGFWIGTMGVALEPHAGAIYRYYRGELRLLYPEISIPNAICFSPDGRTAYFADTPTQCIQRVTLDDAGWPDADPEVLVDLHEEDRNPDGAVVDAEGNIWNAQWGAARVACYAPDGTFLRAVDVPAMQATCPAFGEGTLYVTSAAEGVTDPAAGQTFALDLGVRGQREHQVIL